MKTLKNIKVGDILTDAHDDCIKVETVNRIDGRSVFVVSYPDDEVDTGLAVWTIEELKEFNYWIKEEEYCNGCNNATIYVDDSTFKCSECDKVSTL